MWVLSTILYYLYSSRQRKSIEEVCQNFSPIVNFSHDWACFRNERTSDFRKSESASLRAYKVIPIWFWSLMLYLSRFLTELDFKPDLSFAFSLGSLKKTRVFEGEYFLNRESRCSGGRLYRARLRHCSVTRSFQGNASTFSKQQITIIVDRDVRMWRGIQLYNFQDKRIQKLRYLCSLALK